MTIFAILLITLMKKAFIGTILGRDKMVVMNGKLQVKFFVLAEINVCINNKIHNNYGKR